MSEWLNSVFSGEVRLERVNPVGIVLMAAAVVLNIAAGALSKRCREEERQRVHDRIKVASLLLVCIGAAIAIF